MRAFVVGLTGQVIRSHSMVGMRHDTEHTQGDPTIAFFDVDNTLLDNDRVLVDLSRNRSKRYCDARTCGTPR